jgi:hypothetical protein
LWLEAVQPVKEFHQHFQSILLVGLHLSMHLRPPVPNIWFVLDAEVLPLESDRIIEGELRSTFENIRDGIPREVQMEEVRHIGENEGNVTGQVGKDAGQSGKCIVSTNTDARDSAIGED